MGIRTFSKGVKDSYKTHLAPAVSTFKDDVSERAKAAKIQTLEEQLAKAKAEPEDDDEDEQTTVVATVVQPSTQE